MSSMSNADKGLLQAMCGEVQDLIANRLMAKKFALDVFVVLSDNGNRVALPFDKQRLVLWHLGFSEDGCLEYDVRFRGPALTKRGQRLSHAAIVGGGHESA